MNKWVSLYGNFETRDENIIFNGQEFRNVTGEIQPLVGEILLEDKMLSGAVSVDIEFESCDIQRSEEAGVILNYLSQDDFICAGISGNVFKYDVKHLTKGSWQQMGAAGAVPQLQKEKIHIEIKMDPSVLRLLADGIEVVTVPLSFMLKKSSVGLWACSKRKIIFSNLKVETQKPELFVISQYGGIYDQLYNEVIKPICERKNIRLKRADEETGATPILTDIINSIRTANIIIADITPDNPNVFYELGYAHAIGKNVILLCDAALRQKLPFDISGYRTIFYDNTMSGKNKFETKVNDYIATILSQQNI